MSKKQPKHACSYRVFSGERCDIGGHPCCFHGKVKEEGKWWCSRHVPSVRKAKEKAWRDKLAAKWKADEERWKKQWDRETKIKRLIDVAADLENDPDNSKLHETITLAQELKKEKL